MEGTAPKGLCLFLAYGQGGPYVTIFTLGALSF